MIKSKKQKLGIEIDLTGPQGNVFFLIVRPKIWLNNQDQMVRKYQAKIDEW